MRRRRKLVKAAREAVLADQLYVMRRYASGESIAKINSRYGAGERWLARRLRKWRAPCLTSPTKSLTWYEQHLTKTPPMPDGTTHTGIPAEAGKADRLPVVTAGSRSDSTSPMHAERRLKAMDDEIGIPT
ncbi:MULTISPECIES: hypothetical protein [Streptomyces]|uniref:hypothetical protein n=1 Tax=Streptomyces TaxID=1883 RepID=UPI0011817147|nr:hypothetical protein [Streptomyces kasugaensis]